MQANTNSRNKVTLRKVGNKLVAIRESTQNMVYVRTEHELDPKSLSLPNDIFETRAAHQLARQSETANTKESGA